MGSGFAAEMQQRLLGLMHREGGAVDDEEHDGGDDAEVGLDPAGVPAGDLFAEVPGEVGAEARDGVDALFVEGGGEEAEGGAEEADKAGQAAPDVAVHPVGELGREGGPGEDGGGVELINPELAFQHAEEAGLFLLERVGGAVAAVDEPAKADPNGDEDGG